MAKKIGINKIKSLQSDANLKQFALRISQELIEKEGSAGHPLMKQYRVYCLQKELESYLLSFKKKVEKGIYILLNNAGVVVKEVPENILLFYGVYGTAGIFTKM